MQLAPNLVIAERFRLNRQLGRGGMGSVWHATHLGLDIPCAVKFIEGEYAQLPEAQARFEREAKAAAQLRSPHVVQILDHGVWQGTPYIAMELLDGEDLAKRIQRVGRMNPRELVVIMTQVCRALTKAHTANIVHRDLKPDNIFLVRDDDREIAKVLDFGIAKANTNALEGSNTKTGAMLGTPYYMSPEQAQGTKSVDWRADLWSLAVIVFQATTGQLPFQSEALGDLLVKIIVSPIPVPSQLAPDVSPNFDRWWARAAARDPSQRFQTAKEFADSLSVCLGLSQLTDVMDRHQVRAAIAGGPPMATPPGYGNTPQPGMHMTPQPGMHMTPQPGMGHTPQPGYGNTPQPGMHMTPQPGMPMTGTAGMPHARTFGGAAVSTGLPKKKSNLGLFAVIGVLVLGGGGAGLAVALTGGSDGGSAASGGTSTAAGTAAANPTPTNKSAAETATTGAATGTAAAATGTGTAAATTASATASSPEPTPPTTATAPGTTTVAAAETTAIHPIGKATGGHVPVVPTNHPTTIAASPPPPPPPPPHPTQKAKDDIGF